MRQVLGNLLLLGFIVFFCTGMGFYGDLPSYEKADPEADLKRAIQRDDLRFIAMRGYVVEVPGVDDYGEKFSRYGYKVIEGSSDNVQDYEHGRLMAIAKYYATTYNLLLIRHIDQIESQAMTKALPGEDSIREEFIIQSTSTGSINMLPESLHLSLISRKDRCVNRAWWFDPLKAGQPTYNGSDFLTIYNKVNDLVCRHTWIAEWIASGQNRSAEAQIFGIRPYTETTYDLFVKTPWHDAGVSSEPLYEVNLREGEDCVGTLFIGEDGKQAMITVSNPKGGTHWLDHQKLFYHPKNSSPEVIIVDQAGKWEKRVIPQHN